MVPSYKKLNKIFLGIIKNKKNQILSKDEKKTGKKWSLPKRNIISHYIPIILLQYHSRSPSVGRGRCKNITYAM